MFYIDIFSAQSQAILLWAKYRIYSIKRRGVYDFFCMFNARLIKGGKKSDFEINAALE